MSKPTQKQELLMGHIDRDNLPFAPCEDGTILVPVSSATEERKEKKERHYEPDPKPKPVLITTLISEKYGHFDLVKN